MRSSFVAANLVFALAVAAMSGPAGAADAPLAAAEKDARFFLAVCQNALDDLAAVSRLAAEQNWDSMVDPRFPESKPEWIDGMWRINRDDRSYCSALRHNRQVFGDMTDTSSLRGFGCREAIHAVGRRCRSWISGVSL
jgi:hypothetical protein